MEVVVVAKRSSSRLDPGRRRARQWARERARTLVRERALWKRGIEYVAGVDEVGVGPLAGPVVAAAVVLPKDVRIDGVRDSKRVGPARRIRLAAEIREAALAVGVGLVDVLDVDRLNVYQASLTAMARAVANLRIRPEHLLVDARAIPACEIAQTSIVDGDDLVYSIASASIVAKVYRDACMVDLERRYPGYGFARHAGYATQAHLRALAELGPCPAHRRSFAPVRARLQSGVDASATRPAAAARPLGDA